MSTGVWLLVFWIVTFAAWLLVHVIALVRVLAAEDVTKTMKRWSLLPIATPWIAWRSGFRVPAVLWVAFGVLYVVLRAMG